MKIYLCRHGETDYNKNRLIMGHLPIPLNKTGQQQAEVLANVLESKQIKIIYSSDLKRTEETTAIINSTLNVPVIYYEELREHTLGEYDGMGVSEFLDELDSVEEFDKLMIESKGEITDDFVERVWDIFNKIAEMNVDKDNILIMTHGGCIRSIIAKILEASAIIFDNLKQDNCCINEIIYTKKDNKSNFLIESVNDMCHFK